MSLHVIQTTNTAHCPIPNNTTNISPTTSKPALRLSLLRHTPYRNNAEKVLDVKVDVLASPEALKLQLTKVMEEICPFLLTTTTTTEEGVVEETSAVDNLVVKRLGGGLSNHLFIVSSPSSVNHSAFHPSSVLVRITPDVPEGSVSVVDREMENQLVAWLSQENCAPIFYGRFVNGRVEEFYDHVEPLSCHDMADYAPQIAPQMATFHKLVAPTDILPRPPKGAASLYNSVDTWLAAIQKNQQVDTTNPTRAAFVERLTKEWTWLLGQLQCEEEPQFPGKSSSPMSPEQKQAWNFIRQVVLTHMDAQPLNFLKDTSNKLHLIDFEYAGWNPRAADIANTFCEHCDCSNMCADYPNEYPSTKQQDFFFQAYYQATCNSTEATLSDECLEILRAEVGRFTLLSHLSWSVWSVVKSTEESGIDFDYMAYAAHRMDGYEWGKQTFFA